MSNKTKKPLKKQTRDTGVWDFVFRHFPDYHRSDEIARADDLQKIIDGEINGDAAEMWKHEFKYNKRSAQKAYDEQHKYIYEAAIEGYLEKMKEILEKDEDLRQCDHCGSTMSEGFVYASGEKYYCSEHCLHEHIDPEMWAKLSAGDDAESYWTQWKEGGKDGKEQVKKDRYAVLVDGQEAAVVEVEEGSGVEKLIELLKVVVKEHNAEDEDPKYMVEISPNKTYGYEGRYFSTTEEGMEGEIELILVALYQ